MDIIKKNIGVGKERMREMCVRFKCVGWWEVGGIVICGNVLFSFSFVFDSIGLFVRYFEFFGVLMFFLI